MTARPTPLPDHPWLGQLDDALFVQSFPRTMTDVELASFLEATAKLVFGKHSPYAWVVDVGGLLHASAKQRRMFADFEMRVREHDRRFCAGAAIFAPHPITRGIVTAVFWLSPPSYPYLVTGSLAEAHAYARHKLALARR
jgi:hypothetical protein